LHPARPIAPSLAMCLLREFPQDCTTSPRALLLDQNRSSFMLDLEERWVGPFQIRGLLEHCLDDAAIPRAPESGSAYLVTRNEWQSNPTAESAPLYVGGNTGTSARFRTRVGDLLADSFGFYTFERGHSSGGQHVHRWCRENQVNPLDLYIAWIEGTECHRCLEGRLFRELKPKLNRSTPSKCKRHI
jgi:hypothetical protein